VLPILMGITQKELNQVRVIMVRFLVCTLFFFICKARGGQYDEAHHRNEKNLVFNIHDTISLSENPSLHGCRSDFLSGSTQSLSGSFSI
jgi:hypothetical protein